MHQRRHLRADGHVQERRRSEHGPGAGAKPRGAGAADFARPGEAPRRDGEKEIAQRVDDRQFVLARRQPRQFISEQLRHDSAQRRTFAAAGRRRHHLPRPARLQHAAVARSGENGRRAICRPPTWSRPSNSRTRKWPPGKSASRR